MSVSTQWQNGEHCLSLHEALPKVFRGSQRQGHAQNNTRLLLCMLVLACIYLDMTNSLSF